MKMIHGGWAGRKQSKSIAECIVDGGCGGAISKFLNWVRTEPNLYKCFICMKRPISCYEPQSVQAARLPTGSAGILHFCKYSLSRKYLRISPGSTRNEIQPPRRWGSNSERTSSTSRLAGLWKPLHQLPMIRIYIAAIGNTWINFRKRRIGRHLFLFISL